MTVDRGIKGGISTHSLPCQNDEKKVWIYLSVVSIVYFKFTSLCNKPVFDLIKCVVYKMNLTELESLHVIVTSRLFRLYFLIINDLC